MRRVVPTFAFNRHRTLASMTDFKVALDEFAFRQFDDPNYAGTRLASLTKEAFMEKVTEFLGPRRDMESAQLRDCPTLVDGYAPFCKHIFMPNTFMPDLRTPVVEITADNEHLLRSRYEARTEKELPVLTRYFPVGSGIEPPQCTWFDLILYSREQIEKENAATGKRVGELDGAPWRLICIKAQDVPFETPMQPITVMRNALISEGGSGVTIDRAAYERSVEYWSKHAPVA